MQMSMRMRALMVAGAALVAAGAVAAALGEETVGPTAPTVLTSTSGMEVGDSATTTTEPPSTMPTPIAKPALKATVPCGFTSGC
jgi:hypothetical protein